MDIFDNELEIIDSFRKTKSSEVLLLPENDASAEKIYLSIIDEWEKWTNSSGKSDPPPDFFSDELELMMDVMRVDDHGRIGKNGKSIVNPTRERESKVTEELRQSGIFDMVPNAKLYLLVDTKLPTDEDHNYRFYRDNFIRTVSSHIKKISNYKLNHPSLKTIFMVFDESSLYFESLEPIKVRKVGGFCRGNPHLWFLDKAFMSIVEDSEIDYFIWFTPYKHCGLFTSNNEKIELPKATLINIRKFTEPLRNYNIANMISAEL